MTRLAPRLARKPAVAKARRAAAVRPPASQPAPSGPSIGELTYRRVRADIVFGRLNPGQRLTLDRMRGAYGAAVSTLRELLNRLASEGLILAEGSRGFEVATISAANLREIADMRELLERHALRASFERGDIEWEGRVVAAHHKLASTERRLAASEPREQESWRRFDRDFHCALVSACGSAVLLDTYSAIYDKYLRYLVIAAVFRGAAAASEHRELMELALRRDWKAAQATISVHIQDCVAQMLASRRVA